MKKIFLYFIILSAHILAQPDFKIGLDIIQSGSFFNSEIHYFPSEQDYSVYYSYKISYSQLYFEKKGGLFNAGINLNIEIKDSTGNTVKRGFDDRKISIEDFEITNSKSDFLQGVINFRLPEGKYHLITIISDQTTKRERRIPPIDLTLNISNSILNPMVLNPEKVNCDKLNSYVLSNNSSSIPFNNPNNDLVIPVSDPKINSITFSIKRGDTVIVSSDKITNFFNAIPEIKLCDEKIIISQSNDTTDIKIFIIKNISSKLSEGPIQLEIYPDDSVNVKKIFDLNVIWIAKPFSLIDPEVAIKLLEIVESKKIVSDLLNKRGSDSDNLFDYWNSKDPTPDTKYNELMNEFYSRVDYCEKNFQTISGNGGARSDRGKTYVKYGAPDLIERDTNSDDKVVESWFYKKSNRKFVFIDIEGIGKFQLTDGQ